MEVELLLAPKVVDDHYSVFHEYSVWHSRSGVALIASITVFMFTNYAHYISSCTYRYLQITCRVCERSISNCPMKSTVALTVFSGRVWFPDLACKRLRHAKFIVGLRYIVVYIWIICSHKTHHYHVLSIAA